MLCRCYPFVHPFRELFVTHKQFSGKAAKRLFCSKDQQSSDTALAEELERRRTKIDFTEIKYPTKVPETPISCINLDKSPDYTPSQIVDSQTLQLLERLSLVDLDSKEALRALEDSIEFAEKVVKIHTGCVRPMYTVLENHPLKTRPDKVTDGNIKEDILKNASVTEEDYFVAPPGNIPLETKEKKFD